VWGSEGKWEGAWEREAKCGGMRTMCTGLSGRTLKPGFGSRSELVKFPGPEPRPAG